MELRDKHARPYVLVVDDHPMNCEVFSLLLEHAGFRVRVARDGQEAVDLAKGGRPSVILMDLNMPRMDGFQAAAALREVLGGGVPVLAVTAAPVTRKDLEHAGFCGLLQKPVSGKALVEGVRACTSRNGQTKEWITEAQRK